MIITSDNSLIRYTGRWDYYNSTTVSTANGNYFEFMYKGETAIMYFDIKDCKKPFPHLFIAVDDSPLVESSLESFIRISGKDDTHYVKVILKSSSETQNRWLHPLTAKVALEKIEADEFLPLKEDNRPKIEFIGDSITEGISIDPYLGTSPAYDNHDCMVFWDDATADYSHLTAEALDMRPYIMGYGCLGTTTKGAGNIPVVEEAYPFYSNSRPMESVNADYIVINHGTNDRRSDADKFIRAYYSFLKCVRDRNGKSVIICVTPFSGCLAKEIKIAVDNFNKDFSDNVFYIDSTGWVPAEPIHPNRASHKKIAENLSRIIKKNFLEE